MKNVFHTPECAARDPRNGSRPCLLWVYCRAEGGRNAKGAAVDEVGNEKVPNGLRMTHLIAQLSCSRSEREIKHRHCVNLLDKRSNYKDIIYKKGVM